MRTVKELQKIGKCPKCGDGGGYYHYQINRLGVFYDFAGNQTNVSDAICEKELKKVYCENCHSHIATYST